MSWVTVVWSMLAAACLTVAGIHLLLGFRGAGRAHLLFALTAISGGALALLELALMRAETPEQFGRIVRWIHIPIFVLVASIALFVHALFRAGRPWLMWATIATRGAASLVVNFLRSPNLNFVAITDLRRVPLLGEMVAVPTGIVSSWTRLAELSSLLLLLFLVDATITVWRRGDRRRAATVGASAILCVVVSAGNSALIHAGVLQVPYLISIPYFGMVLAMSYELSFEVLHAAELSRNLQRSETALQESEGQLALVAEAANLSVWVWDIDRDEVHITEPGRTLRGFGPGNRVGFGRFLSTIHPDDRESVSRSVAESLENGGAFEREHRIVLANGHVRWVMARGRVEQDESGKPVRVRGVSLDMNAQKLSELESEQQRAELAHLSRVATLGELSGSLAHELNQPLTAILSNAQAALRFLGKNGGNAGEVGEILRDIVDADRRAGEIIGRLRPLFKKGEIRPQALDVEELVRDALRLVHSEMIGLGVTATTDVTDDLPRVCGDRVQILQVLLNLIKNACDAMAETDPHERWLMLRAVSDGEHVEVSVADRGCGIPQERVDRIFEPFITTKAQGMGLGLAVCRTIIKAHDGRLWASNNAAGGATFRFTLPTAVGDPS